MAAALQHTALSRRHFLVGSSALAVGAGLAGRSLVRPALAQAHQPSDAAWRALADKLSGPVLRAGGYDLGKVARSFNLRYARNLPDGVALCRSPADVATAILWCRENQFPLIVQSGGHSYAGFSMRRSGLMINTRLMRGAKLANGVATVAGGVLNQDLYALLEQNDLAITHGRCPTVGAAGFLLGGGIGFNMRSNGVACDQLTASEIVTADGRVRTLQPAGDDLTNDLYWASRGGGGGNFGVNTSFSLQTFPAEPVTVFDLTWTSATKNPDRVAAKLVTALEGAPIELGLGTRMSLGARSPADRAAGANVSISLIGQAKHADARRLEALLADAYAEEKPQRAIIRSDAPYWSAQKLLEDDDGPTWFQERSTFAPRGKALEALDHIFGHLRTWPGTNGGADLRLFQTGGMMNRTPADSTAFVHRDSEWIMVVGLGWDGSDSWDTVTRARLWQDRFYDALRAYTVGAYQNFIDPSLTDWRTAYYGKNLARLEAIKRKIDPDRVFDFPQAI